MPFSHSITDGVTNQISINSYGFRDEEFTEEKSPLTSPELRFGQATGKRFEKIMI